MSKLPKWKSWFNRVAVKDVDFMYQYEYSSVSLGCLWLLILVLHVVLCLTALVLSLGELFVAYTPVNAHGLDLSGIPVNLSISNFTFVFMLVVALLHCKTIVQMLWASIRQRRLSFRMPKWLEPKPVHVKTSSRLSFMVSLPSDAMQVYSRLFGIRGRYFEVAFHTREILEVSAVFLQAYQMSHTVITRWLNQYVVIVLVLNCWLTPLLEFIMRKNVRLQRFVLVWFDLLLDLAISVGLPILLLFQYYLFYLLYGEPPLRFHQPDKFLFFKGEITFFFNNTWTSVAVMIIIRLSILNTLDTLSKIIVFKSNQVQATSVGPSITDIHTQAISSPKKKSKVAHAAFLICSLTALISHLTGGYLGRLQLHPAAFCESAFRPWFHSQVVCAAVVVNCHRAGMNGSRAEMEEVLSTILDSNVRTLALSIGHCPYLEFPHQLQSFHDILCLDIYNSTIMDWPSASALDTTGHLSLLEFRATYVNFTEGILPDGLLSERFPSSLQSIYLAVTNLQRLPEDLDAKWSHELLLLVMKGTSLYELPESFGKLQVQVLQLDYADAPNIPSSLLQKKSYLRLTMTGSQLPLMPVLQANEYPSIAQLQLDGSNLTSLEDWMWPPFTSYVSASGTPLCQKLTSGKAQENPQQIGHIFCGLWLESREKLQDFFQNVYINGTARGISESSGIR